MYLLAACDVAFVTKIFPHARLQRLRHTLMHAARPKKTGTHNVLCNGHVGYNPLRHAVHAVRTLPPLCSHPGPIIKPPNTLPSLPLHGGLMYGMALYSAHIHQQTPTQLPIPHTQTLGLQQYASAFAAHSIDIDILPDIHISDLQELGVHDAVHQQTLLHAAQSLRHGDAHDLHMTNQQPLQESNMRASASNMQLEGARVMKQKVVRGWHDGMVGDIPRDGGEATPVGSDDDDADGGGDDGQQQRAEDTALFHTLYPIRGVCGFACIVVLSMYGFHIWTQNHIHNTTYIKPHTQNHTHTALVKLQAPATPPLLPSRIPSPITHATLVPPHASMWHMAAGAPRPGPTLDELVLLRAQRCAKTAAMLEAVAQREEALCDHQGEGGGNSGGGSGRGGNGHGNNMRTCMAVAQLQALRTELLAAQRVVATLERMVQEAEGKVMMEMEHAGGGV